MPAGGSAFAGWAVAGVGVEDPLAVQPGQHLHRLAGQLVGQRARVVPGVQNHQWRCGALGLFAGGRQVGEQAADLGEGDLGVVVSG